ncbi:DoxX family membrane protein [Muricauda ruestringensis]|uniref:DoxX family membrane protein n=1 Tax=Flagellimonas aurea TaxID=2915619 RepID=A0ABS3G3E2_9FLAO|nr:BT_3928 family protein [Allomuricauda aurea]MAO17127.1 DoxX family protein [Allomuricauda sp.]MBC70993.1 DoxX family protein [Allomuricauda sp.]MBO0353929.1 DoxX family membrane protein [Allomuricauda aurea]|tara:strand:+ start:686 stop:1780 length:1095 start_codon:yes stop_codon:yes gene_type:complete
MKYLVWISRIIVGVLFIISGLIKLNDPMGFSFKLEEYFSPGVLDLPFLTPLALAISIFVVIVEVILGILLLIGFKPKFTVWSLLLMIVFFTFLTFYSAYFNKVTDCGCFGDAIKLTPWESFTKDVILLVFILILFFGRKYITPLFSPKVNWIVGGVSLLACALFANHVLAHLPSVDFRPYKIGANIQEGMSVPEDAPQPIYEYAWRFKVDGEEKIYVTEGDYPTVDGEFIDVETTQIQAGYEPPIHDFTIEQEGQNYASELLEEDKLVMVIAYDMAKSNLEAFEEVAEVTAKAKQNGYKVIGMSASSSDMAEKIIATYGLDFEFYFTDETTLKTIVRSNPAILVLSKGTIQQKVHYNDFEELEF